MRLPAPTVAPAGRAREFFTESIKSVLFFSAAAALVLAVFLIKNANTLAAGKVGLFVGWNFGQYFVNYFDCGFVKRGFIGSFVYFVPKPDKPAAILCFNIAVLVALAAVATKALCECDKRLARRQMLMLVAVVVFSPFTFANLAFDFGRFDQINLLILFVSLWLLRGERIFSVALLTGAAMLIHEAYLFYGVPLLYLYQRYLLAAQNDRWATGPVGTRAFRIAFLRKTGPVSIVLVLCLGLLLFFGRYEPGRAQLREVIGGPSESYTVSELDVWTRPVLKNIIRVDKRWHRVGYAKGQLACYAFVLLCFLIAITQAYKANGARLDLLALAPAGVLPLFFIGIDYARWLSLIWIVCVAVFIIKILEGDFDRLFRLTTWNVPFLIVLCAIVLGPIGVLGYFPLLPHILGWL